MLATAGGNGVVGWTGIKNFTKAEVACPHCGKVNMSILAIEKFQRARDYVGKPIYGASFCRCEYWNMHVGGVENSSHLITDTLQCTAGDVTLVRLDANRNPLRPMTSHERYELMIALYEAGFRRIGIHKSFFHADNDRTKPRKMLWLYS